MCPRRLLILALACGCATAGPPTGTSAYSLKSAEAEDIAKLEDQRVLGAGRIEALVRQGAPAVRARALLALARLQAPETTAIVAAALEDPEAQVRAMAAFALGELGLAWTPLPEKERALAERRLIERLATEGDDSVVESILEALGKVGADASLPPLSRALEGPHAGRAAIALAVMAKSSGGKLKAPAAVLGLAALLGSRAADQRFAGAYALMRYQEPAGRAALTSCLTDAAFEVRASCARGLAALGSAEDAGHVAALLDDSDERVAAEAGRGLARLVAGCAKADDCPALAALARAKAPWRPAVAKAVADEAIVLPAAAPVFAAQMAAVAKAMEAAKDELARRTLAREHCELALSHDRAISELNQLLKCGFDLVPRAERSTKAARALSESKGAPESRTLAFIELARSADPAARAAAAGGLGALGTPQANAAIIALLADPDWNVASEAAGAVEAAKLSSAAPALVALLERVKGEESSEAAQAALSAATALKLDAVVPAARKLLVEGPPHVRQAAAKAIGALTGQTPKATPPPWDSGPYAREDLPDRVEVRLRTERGPVRIQLFPLEAPMTVRSFLHLARKGFFDGLTFHRVVPDFVAQGGDPRGDGSGGPGYSVRCEINQRRYQVGTVGMALSGKDTGGSQFFIMLSPQPHLDGRYTVFGKVLEGMDAVRELSEGDRILSVDVLASAGSTRQ